MQHGQVSMQVTLADCAYFTAEISDEDSNVWGW